MKTVETVYQLVSSPCPVREHGDSAVYGVHALREGEVAEEAVFYDISPHKEDINRLIHMLKKGNVTPDQLCYIVEDYIYDLHAY